jgi:hypothetical protein
MQLVGTSLPEWIVNDQSQRAPQAHTLHLADRHRKQIHLCEDRPVAKPHTPARNVGKDVPDPDDLQTSYPDMPEGPGLVGGPATEAVPGSHATHVGPSVVTDDGGETTLPGRPRETGGARPRSDGQKEAEPNT